MRRALTFLAPNMRPVYEFMLRYAGERLGVAFDLAAGERYEDLSGGDLSFVCGLPYVLRTPPRQVPAPMEALVAPVLTDPRCAGKPIYFSDVIVRRDSPFQTFADLRGCRWAYNEPESQSGYGITRYTLLRRGETGGFFGEVIEAGFHQRAIQMVLDGEIDAAAIDWQVLAVERRDHPDVSEQLRVIDAFGPSTIQPVAVAPHLPDDLKAGLRAVFTTMHDDPAARAVLERGFIERFVAVTDSDYDDIRAMLAACEAADFLILK